MRRCTQLAQEWRLHLCGPTGPGASSLKRGRPNETIEPTANKQEAKKARGQASDNNATALRSGTWGPKSKPRGTLPERRRGVPRSPWHTAVGQERRHNVCAGPAEFAPPTTRRQSHPSRPRGAGPSMPLRATPHVAPSYLWAPPAPGWASPPPAVMSLCTASTAALADSSACSSKPRPFTAYAPQK